MTQPSTCNPCCSPDSLAGNEWSYRASVLHLLCQILAASGGGTGVPVLLGLVEKDYSFFTNAYQATGLADSAEKIKGLRIINDTDGIYEVSFNNSDAKIVIPAYDKYDMDYGGDVPLDVDVYMKYIQGPSLGKVYISGYY